MTAVDLHQHLWPELFIELLRSRTRPPYLRGQTLHTTAEPPYDVDPADHDAGARAERDALDGIGLACVSLSAPLGIEALPRGEADQLIDAWHVSSLAGSRGAAPCGRAGTRRRVARSSRL